ncbi:MAG: hypothetical protein K0Q72_135 [Armatimonadetes bacterium]|nr:hypothetical protein [Armatimonadota bacterium]
MDSFKLEGPAAMLVMILLVGSLGLNVWSLTRKPEMLTVQVGGASAANATMPGEKNPLNHIPAGPRDAVGMPAPATQ